MHTLLPSMHLCMALKLWNDAQTPHKQGWQSSVRNSTSAEQTTEIFRCRLVSSFDFKDEKIFRPSVRPSSSWTTVRSMLTLNKYECNRLNSYCKFKKYEKFRPMSSIFVHNTICHGIHMKTPCGWHDSCDRVPGYGWKSTADDTIPVTESDSGLAKSRAISYFRSLGSWEFGHGEPSHERATTKARLGSLWNLLGSLTRGSLGRLAEPIHVTYISCVSAKNSFNCMLPSRHNQDWIWYYTIKVFER